MQVRRLGDVDTCFTHAIKLYYADSRLGRQLGWSRNGHIDGAPQSVMGRIFEEGPGAGHSGDWHQHYPEHRSLTSLTMWRAFHGIDLPTRNVLDSYYTDSRPVKVKARELGYEAPSAYYTLLQVGHSYLKGRFELLIEGESV